MGCRPTPLFGLWAVVEVLREEEVGWLCLQAGRFRLSRP